MGRSALLTSRERVRLALAHQQTDRTPIAMICSGINRPARERLEEYLRRERDLTVDAYLDPLIDIVGIGPDYVGPPLPSGGRHVGSVPETGFLRPGHL